MRIGMTVVGDKKKADALAKTIVDSGLGSNIHPFPLLYKSDSIIDCYKKHGEWVAAGEVDACVVVKTSPWWNSYPGSYLGADIRGIAETADAMSPEYWSVSLVQSAIDQWKDPRDLEPGFAHWHSSATVCASNVVYSSATILPLLEWIGLHAPPSGGFTSFHLSNLITHWALARQARMNSYGLRPDMKTDEQDIDWNIGRMVSIRRSQNNDAMYPVPGCNLVALSAPNLKVAKKDSPEDDS